MKALEMKRSTGATELQKVLHSIDMAFFAGLKSASIYHTMSEKTIDGLLEEGFDILIFRTRMRKVLLYEVLWIKAKEGRRGEMMEVITETQKEVEEKRELLLKQYYCL